MFRLLLPVDERVLQVLLHVQPVAVLLRVGPDLALEPLSSAGEHGDVLVGGDDVLLVRELLHLVAVVPQVDVQLLLLQGGERGALRYGWFWGASFCLAFVAGGVKAILTRLWPGA